MNVDDDIVFFGGFFIFRVLGVLGFIVGFVVVDKVVYLLNNKGFLIKNLVKNGLFIKSNDRLNFYGFLCNN